MGLREIAQQVASAQASGGGNYIKHGRGVMVVKEAFYKEDLDSGRGFIVELLVDTVEPYIGSDGKPLPCNPPGSTVSFVQLFDKFKKTSMGNTKAFIEALSGESLEGEKFVERFEKLVSEKNPGRGLKIGFSTYEKMTQSGGKLLILPKWEHVEQTPEDVKATRERLKL